jgi:hypothetical protein
MASGEEMNHISDDQLQKEINTAILFDLRDNPNTKAMVDFIVNKYGADGNDKFIALLKEDIENLYNHDPRTPLFPWTRSAMQTAIDGGINYHEMGLGQWGAIIGSAIQALAQVGTSVYTAKLAQSTQLKIVKLQTEKQTAEANAAAAQANAANAALVENAKAVVTGTAPAGSSGPMVAQSGMMDGIGMPLLVVGAVGVGGYLLYQQLKG